jgi:GPI mannosyltransferase 1 subunit M
MGRYIFCIADTICGYMIVLYRRQNRTVHTNAIHSDRNNSNDDDDDDDDDAVLIMRLYDSMWWLYNPLAWNICTRGSAESLVVLLPVLMTVWIASSPTTTSQLVVKRSWCRDAVLAGICHGVAIHAKLYPVIYTLSFMTAFVPKKQKSHSRIVQRTTYGIILLWIRRLLTPAPLLFGGTAVVTFVLLTYAAVRLYGDDALYEGLLYHFSRVDHRHNYSMHWYWIYLLRDRIMDATNHDSNNHMIMTYIGRILLLPQLILLLYTSLGVAPVSLALALFIQTFLFVAHNKVITAQYFTWYLCLLPLCSDYFRWTRRVQLAVILLILSILVWLGSAYCLEMQGMAVHQIVWMASLLFFLGNVNLLGALLSTTTIMPIQPSKSKEE